MLRELREMIKRVYRYEKAMQIDTQTLQMVLCVFSAVLFLINIHNIMLGKTLVSLMTFVVACLGAGACVAIRYIQNIYRLCWIVIILFLVPAAPILIFGANDGFSLLWYLLLPIVTLFIFGMSVGVPLCTVFGIVVTVVFWTSLSDHLQYAYMRDYRTFYPFFYWGFCLLVLIVEVFYRSYQMQQAENEKRLEEEVLRAVADTKRLMVDSVTAISRMLDQKDTYTQEHSRRVAEYSRLIAEQMTESQFSKEDIDLIYRSALLHDIGKIAVPDEVLNKPERLNDEEYEIMKKHTIWGKQILSEMSFLAKADLGASYHHERYDGKGYPYGLKGEQLPLIARIISAADALDAMNSNRCYRRHCDREYILSELEKGAGAQFDPRVAEIVTALIREGRIEIL